MTEQTSRQPTHEGVVRAAAKIAEILPPTPLLPIEINGTQCWVKCENLQPIGAFKIRGGWHRLSDLNEEERARGVVGVSSGNHAQGVAWAAKKLGIEAALVMPHDAPLVKTDRVRALGAEVITYTRPIENRDEIATRICKERGAVLVHAFADPWVIEGQGSMGIEIIDQLGHEPSLILACCGGGGLSGGLALACPSSQIVPVEPIGWDQMGQSLKAGEIVSQGPNPPKTICDALQPMAPKPINLAILRDRSAPGLTVSDDEVRAAQRFAFDRLRLVVEPGGAAALAAALSGKAELNQDTVIIITGGNVDPQKFAETITAQG
ncbi:MAG TPA: pyridoxal-5'-phosphate-dependent protein [Erythrobacter sp.]|nr:pyridoxal-5'-phosphate-dependent protein [Erythrobacter sp.]